MSYEEFTQWTCTRCQQQQRSLSSRGELNWSRLYVATPPLSTEHNVVADLCDPCYSELLTFLGSPESTENGGEW
jgi:hypothetical protein